MITNGFVPGYSDIVTLDTFFSYNGTRIPYSMYIVVSGGSGDVVWENTLGQAQWLPNCFVGATYIVGATRILTSATVNGTSRTTTATGLVWMG